jgi:hypothetical protein
MDLDKRQASARRIAARLRVDPTCYKLCVGCDSIIAGDVDVCPNCHGYRFNTEVDDVVAQAFLLGDRAQQSVTPEDLNPDITIKDQ